MSTFIAARTQGDNPLGGLLREWRRKRRISQLNLAVDAEIPMRELALLETGRSLPSRQMLLHLAGCMDIPLRDRNVLLSTAGFRPLFQEREFHAPDLDVVRHSVEAILAAHDPNPALVVDRNWTMLAANRSVAHLVAGAEPMLLRPPVNVLRLFLHPAGLATRIINLAQWREYMITRLRRQIDASGDGAALDLLEEVRDYPGVRGGDATGPEMDNGMIAIPFRLATIEGVLSFFSTTTVFGTPMDITVSELTIEGFLPADAQTAAVMRRLGNAGATFSKADASPAGTALVA